MSITSESSVWLYNLPTQADAGIATVSKIISEILANDAGVTFSKESRDLLIECCVEFITLISSEANDIAEKEAKKTIACEHVQAALEQLGYPDYVPEILKVAQEHKAQQAVRKRLMWFQLETDKSARAGRRSRARSSRAVCQRRNLSGSNKSYFDQQPISSWQHRMRTNPEAEKLLQHSSVILFLDGPWCVHQEAKGYDFFTSMALHFGG